MGKSVSWTNTRFQQVSKIITSSQKPRHNRKPNSVKTTTSGGAALDSQNLKLQFNMEEENTTRNRIPLSQVVADCAKRWFSDTLKEAKAGDTAMQLLVGQMYHAGYGVPVDLAKGRAWITRASRTRSSVWNVSDKHPGYNASDSDSDEVKAEN